MPPQMKTTEVVEPTATSITEDMVIPPPLATPLARRTSDGSSIRNLPTDKEIKALLRCLRDGKTAADVDDTMKELVNKVNVDEHGSFCVRITVETIVRLDGIAAIIMALREHYVESPEVATSALPLLLKMSVLSREKVRLMIANIGLPTLLSVAGANKENGAIICSVIGILAILYEVDDEDAKEEVSTDECIDLAMDAMKSWPDDEFVQSCCCLYFANIGVVPSTRVRLCRKQVGPLILAALDKFRYSEDQTVYKRAHLAMTTYMAN